MKTRDLSVGPGRWVGTVAIVGMLAGGCASHRESAQFRETERAGVMTTSSEPQRSWMDEMSPWQRERRAQEERFFEASGRD